MQPAHTRELWWTGASEDKLDTAFARSNGDKQRGFAFLCSSTGFNVILTKVMRSDDSLSCTRTPFSGVSMDLTVLALASCSWLTGSLTISRFTPYIEHQLHLFKKKIAYYT